MGQKPKECETQFAPVFVFKPDSMVRPEEKADSEHRVREEDEAEVMNGIITSI
jgi:hypothetical protein